MIYLAQSFFFVQNIPKLHGPCVGKLIYQAELKLLVGSFKKLDIAILHVKEWTVEVTGPQSSIPRQTEWHIYHRETLINFYNYHIHRRKNVVQIYKYG